MNKQTKLITRNLKQSLPKLMTQVINQVQLSTQLWIQVQLHTSRYLKKQVSNEFSQCSLQMSNSIASSQLESSIEQNYIPNDSLLDTSKPISVNQSIANFEESLKRLAISDHSQIIRSHQRQEHSYGTSSEVVAIDSTKKQVYDLPLAIKTINNLEESEAVGNNHNFSLTFVAQELASQDKICQLQNNDHTWTREEPSLPNFSCWVDLSVINQLNQSNHNTTNAPTFNQVQLFNSTLESIQQDSSQPEEKLVQNIYLQSHPFKQNWKQKEHDIMSYPYNAVGMIKLKVKLLIDIGNFPNNQMQISQNAFLINNSTILTSANLFSFLNWMPVQKIDIYFTPSWLVKAQQKIKVYPTYKLHPFYKTIEENRPEISNSCDLTLLKIQQTQTIPTRYFLPINVDYDFQKDPFKEILIIGHNQSNFTQVKGTILTEKYGIIKYSKEGFLFYELETGQWFGSAPIFAKQLDEQNNEIYRVIGIHKGLRDGLSFGILLSSKENRQFLSEHINDFQYLLKDE